MPSVDSCFAAAMAASTPSPGRNRAAAWRTKAYRDARSRNQRLSEAVTNSRRIQFVSIGVITPVRPGPLFGRWLAPSAVVAIGADRHYNTMVREGSQGSECSLDRRPQWPVHFALAQSWLLRLSSYR